MTRKDYILIAEALKAARPTCDGTSERFAGWYYTVRSVADGLAADNPRFDRNRFYAACEVCK